MVASPLDEDSQPVHAYHIGSGLFTSTLLGGDEKIEKYLQGPVEGRRVFQNNCQFFKYKLLQLAS
jgi:hypothetical protein